MKKYFILPFISISALSVHAQSLCSADEKTAFSCPLRNGKTVSLCSSVDADGKNYLHYLFGNKKNIELSYPSKKIPSQKAFRRDYSKYGFHSYVSFSINRNRYGVYGNTDSNDWSHDGVMVNSHLLKCIQPPQKKYFSTIIDQQNIPADQ
ncbi:hypothetical protein [Brachymonas sp.]|uniref:hypothetical protein n=1 Tax=unclassified Brachymonas TaxID=2621329 RepID=UPI0035B2C76A